MSAPFGARAAPVLLSIVALGLPLFAWLPAVLVDNVGGFTISSRLGPGLVSLVLCGMAALAGFAWLTARQMLAGHRVSWGLVAGLLGLSCAAMSGPLVFRSDGAIAAYALMLPALLCILASLLAINWNRQRLWGPGPNVPVATSRPAILPGAVGIIVGSILVGALGFLVQDADGGHGPSAPGLVDTPEGNTLWYWTMATAWCAALPRPTASVRRRRTWLSAWFVLATLATVSSMLAAWGGAVPSALAWAIGSGAGAAYLFRAGPARRQPHGLLRRLTGD